jgi:hypothetical protein
MKTAVKTRPPSPDEQSHRCWTILRLFYLSLVHFRSQFDRYEERVLALASSSGMDRKLLRLNSSDLAGLLDFKELERLRDGFIHKLKDLCHLVFRTQNQTDPLDRYVSDIFHEISILKEEHYTVTTYAPLYERAADQVELKYILDEAHEMFPQKLRHILHLFGKARELMERHLPSFRAVPVIVRSLFLERDGFVKEAYSDGIRSFYRHMYAWGAFEGYYQAGLSFYHAGFFPQALEALALAAAEYDTTVLRELRQSGGEAAKSAPEVLVPIEGVPAPPTRVSPPASMLRSLRAKLAKLGSVAPQPARVQ